MAREARLERRAARDAFVQCPNFIRQNAIGEIEEIMCKVCGIVIAGITETTTERTARDGKLIVTKIRQFQRFHNYAELKLKFTDGSHHVTNGCVDHMVMGLTKPQQRALFEADVNMAPSGYTKDHITRSPAMVVAVGRAEGIV